MAAPECDRFGEDLSAYLDGELPQQRAAQLEQHLLGCDSCRRTFEELRDVAERLAELPHVRAPDELTAAMRRAAERQVLLEARAPHTKVRVWKLFARVSASAALIAACMFAGWHVYERVQRSTIPAIEERLAMAPEGEKTSEEAFGRETRSLDVAQAEPAEQLARPDEAAEPVLAFAGKATGIEAEVPTEADAGVLTREHVAAVGGELQADSLGVPVAATTAATIDVFVTPQDAQQAMAVRGALAAWQEPVGIELEAGKRGEAERYVRGTPAAGVPVVHVGRAGVAETVDRSEFAFELTPAQANELIERLEQQAPRQVFLRYADLQRVQQRAKPVVTDAEEERQPLARGRFGAGAEARRVTTPRRLALRSPAEKQEEMQELRGRARVGQPPAPAKAAKKDEKVATAERGAVTARRLGQPTLGGDRIGGAAGKGAGMRTPERAGEPIAPPASQPPPAAEQPATQPAQPEQLRARVARVRDELGELLFGTFMRAAMAPAAPSEPRPPQLMTVRVMLLPPPQNRTTQPASQPVPQP